MRRGTLCAALVAMTISVLGCASSDPRSSISSADGLRTYSVVREIDGIPAMCGLPNEPSPVRGILMGDPDDPREAVWLLDGDRRRSIFWPEGFTVRFESDAVLYDEQGRAVARAGDVVELPQVATDSAAGTFDDPYIASCQVFGGAYVYRP